MLTNMFQMGWFSRQLDLNLFDSNLDLFKVFSSLKLGVMVSTFGFELFFSECQEGHQKNCKGNCILQALNNSKT